MIDGEVNEAFHKFRETIVARNPVDIPSDDDLRREVGTWVHAFDLDDFFDSAALTAIVGNMKAAMIHYPSTRLSIKHRRDLTFLAAALHLEVADRARNANTRIYRRLCVISWLIIMRCVHHLGLDISQRPARPLGRRAGLNEKWHRYRSDALANEYFRPVALLHVASYSEQYSGTGGVIRQHPFYAHRQFAMFTAAMLAGFASHGTTTAGPTVDLTQHDYAGPERRSSSKSGNDERRLRRLAARGTPRSTEAPH